MHTSLASGYVEVIKQVWNPQPYGPRVQGDHQALIKVVNRVLDRVGSIGSMTGVWRIPQPLAEQLVTQEYNNYYNSRYRVTHRGIREFLSIVFDGYEECTLVFRDHKESYLVR